MTDARNRPVGLDDLGPRRRRVRCRPSDGPGPPQRANGSAGKARSRNQLAEVVAGPQRAQRRLVAVENGVAIAHRGGPAEVVDRPVGQPGRGGGPRARPVAAGGGCQRRPGAGQPEPVPAVARGQPFEQGDGPAGVGAAGGERSPGADRLRTAARVGDM